MVVAGGEEEGEEREETLGHQSNAPHCTFRQVCEALIAREEKVKFRKHAVISIALALVLNSAMSSEMLGQGAQLTTELLNGLEQTTLTGFGQESKGSTIERNLY